MNTLVGARYGYLKPSLSWYFSAERVHNPGEPRGGERSLSNDVVDAIVGFKGQWLFGNNGWGLPLYADVGWGWFRSQPAARRGPAAL